MNFLSHFYFTQHSNDPYYTLGAVLPDLLRNYGGTWRIFPEKNKNLFQPDPALLSLVKGWELHLEVDRIFHSSPMFIEETGRLRKLLVPVFKRLPIRPFFIAHIGYELMLDSLLIQEKTVSTSLFYQELAACDPLIIAQFLALSGVQETETFARFMESFLESAYLESYKATKNVVYALDRIGRRVWREPFNELENEAAIRVLDQYKKDLSPYFMVAFSEIENTIG